MPAALLLAALAASPAAAGSATFTMPAGLHGSLLIRHVRLIDGTAAPPREDAAVLILDGRIAVVGADVEVAGRPEAQGVATLDADGATAVPGLIDSHVHLQEVIGSDVRRDPPERIRQLRRRQLRSYLACGVTTVLDTAISPDALAELRGWLADGEPGPSVLTLGPPIPARGGYMSFGWPELAAERPEDLERNFAAIEAAGAFGVKVPIERGFGVNVFPIHEPAVRAAIAERAKALDLPIFVHASDEEEQSIGLEMGAHALVHTNFGGAPPSPEFVGRMVASQAYAITTFSIIDAELVRWEPERLDDPLTRIAVPPEELESARDPEAWVVGDTINLGHVFPWLPDLGLRVLAWFVMDEESLRGVVATNVAAARTLHDAGVPVVIGSDAGNFVLAQYHGTSTLREIELLASSGVPTTAVLAAATRVPARMLRLEDEVGTVEVGKRGDLVLVRDDPLRDVRALRTVRWTVKSGVARTPSEWMEDG